MGENYRFTLSELLMALLSLFLGGIVGTDVSETGETGQKIKPNDRPAKLKVTFEDEVIEKDESSIPSNLTLLSSPSLSTPEDDDDPSCDSESDSSETDQSEDEQKGESTTAVQGKPKPTKVTFEDEVLEKDDESSIPSQTPLAEDDDDLSFDSEPDSSETDQSEDCEQKEEESTIAVPAVTRMSRDSADLALFYMDLMNLRTVRCECASVHLLKSYIEGAQARLDEAKRMLDDIPTTMSHTERKVYMLEICQYVEAIYRCLDNLAVKLVECHGATMRDIIQEFSDNMRNKALVIKPKKKKPVIRRVKADRGGALWVMEVGAVLAFLVLTAFVTFLFTRPDIGTVFGGFVLSVANNTWNFTDKMNNRLPFADGNLSS